MLQNRSSASTLVAHAFALFLFCTLMIAAKPSVSQTYPTFTNGVKNGQLLHQTSSTIGASPALFLNGSNLNALYADSSTGNLRLAATSDAVDFYDVTNTGIYIGKDNTPAAISFNGIVYVAYVYTVYCIRRPPL